MVALVIIDQQQGINYPKLGPRNNANAERNILELLLRWRSANRPVIHVKHCSKQPDSVFWPEQAGFEFKQDFLRLQNEWVIEKAVPCAITGSAFASILDELNEKQIVIVGASTNNSVEATARSAGNLGFDTYVVEDACFAFDKRDYYGELRSAAEVHAMSLANLDGEYATVMSADDVLQKWRFSV